MIKRFSTLLVSFVLYSMALAQLPKVYNEDIDPMSQIDDAVTLASQQDKFVICQVGGNWCRWCLMFAKFINQDQDLSGVIDNNFVYIHVNYPKTDASKELMERLKNPGRFGYPVLVVLDTNGDVIHIQDTSLLEEGDGYDKDKVMRFFNNWTPRAVNHID